MWGYWSKKNGGGGGSGGTGTTTYTDYAYSNSGYWGGTVADNMAIYFAPNSATTFKKYDTTTNTESNFGSGTGAIGIVKAPNGKLYTLPYSNTNVYKVDPDTDTSSIIGTVGGTQRYIGGCLASNGKIYAFPFRGPGTILEIDPSTDSIREFGSIGGLNRYAGTVCGSDGFLYGVPYDATQVAKLDPLTDTITFFGSISGSSKYNGGFLGFDNNIYCSPRSAGNWLVIDTVSQLTSTIGSGAISTFGSFLVPKNIGYGVTNTGVTELVELDIAAATSTNLNVSAVAGSGYSGLVGPDGKGYTNPGVSINQLIIENVGIVFPSDFLIPSDLADLPTSNYNRYINKL